MAAAADVNNWEPKIELEPWDHRLTVIGVLLAAGGVLLIPCMTELSYADVRLDLHGAGDGADGFLLGDLNVWRVHWDLSSISRAGTVNEDDQSQWKYHVMHFCGHNRKHRDITDDIIAMKLTHEGRLEKKNATAWQYVGARSSLNALRHMTSVFLYLQTGLAVALSISICGLTVLPIRTMRTTNQALMLCLTALITTLITVVGSAKLGGHLLDDIDHIVPTSAFGDAVKVEWRSGAHLLFASTALHGAAFIFSLVVCCCTRNDPYPRGQGPNFPSEINGEKMPLHYYPYGNNPRGPPPERR